MVNYIDLIDDSVALQLLTGENLKKGFVTLFQLFSANRSNAEARRPVAFHDRFLLLDGSIVWQLGTSPAHASNDGAQPRGVWEA